MSEYEKAGDAADELTKVVREYVKASSPVAYGDRASADAHLWTPKEAEPMPRDLVASLGRSVAFHSARAARPEATDD